MRSPIGLALLFGATLLAVAGPIVADGATGDTPAVWTLQRCLDEAHATSPLLAADRARQDAAAAQVAVARAGRYPVIGLSGSSSYTTETMKMTIPTLPGQPARELEFGDGATADLMLGLQVSLYEGGALAARHAAADARHQAELCSTRADSLDLRLQVRRTFFAALGAEAAARAARRGEARLSRHLDDIAANRRAGTASEETSVLARARLVRQQQATVLVEAEAARLRLALGRLVGRPDLQIRPDAELDRGLLPDTTSNLPFNERPLLRALDAQLTAGDADIQAAAGSLRPSLDLQGGWHYGRPGVDAVTNDWMDYGTVAVGLRWTLLDFGRRYGQIDRLRAGHRALEHQRRDIDRTLRARLATARVQYDAARTAESKARDRVDLQNSYLDLVSARLQEGFATQREYLDAQDDVTLAEIDLATALANLRGAEAEFLAALGY